MNDMSNNNRKLTKKEQHVVQSFMKDWIRAVKVEHPERGTAVIEKHGDTVKVTIPGLNKAPIKFDWIPFEGLVDLFLRQGFHTVSGVNVDMDYLLPNIRKGLR